MLKKVYFTSEFVSPGHPDKICDQISDAVLDACLKDDPNARVACETFATTGLVIVGGEITTTTYIDIQDIVRNKIKEIGYKPGMGFDSDCGVMNTIHSQSPDISMGVDTGGAGDQGIMFGGAVNETKELMPLAMTLAREIIILLTKLTRDKTLKWARPDAKAQVTLAYDETGKKVLNVDTVVLSVQHDENVTHVKLNVTDRENIKELATKVKEQYGKLDILVNNAGITRDSLLQRMKEDDWDLLIDINLKGVYNVMQGFISLLLKSKGASVINMASVVGVDGNAGQTNYAASKGGVIAMAKSWAKEFGRKKLRANAIAPGFIKTDMTHVLPEKVVESVLENTPLRSMGEASDVADTALFLASDMSKFITGQVIRVDGGLNL